MDTTDDRGVFHLHQLFDLFGVVLSHDDGIVALPVLHDEIICGHEVPKVECHDQHGLFPTATTSSEQNPMFEDHNRTIIRQFTLGALFSTGDINKQFP